MSIPANINEHAAYALNFNALCNQNAVTSLTLPDCMVVLRDNAISHMARLQSATLNDGLEVICDTNFNDCPSLTSLTIPASVRLIDDAFKSCASLREIRFIGKCPTFLSLDWSFYDLPEDYVIYVPDDELDAYTVALADAYGNVLDHLQPSGQNAVICDTRAADANTGAITGYTQYHAFVEIPESIGGVAVKSMRTVPCARIAVCTPSCSPRDWNRWAGKPSTMPSTSSMSACLHPQDHRQQCLQPHRRRAGRLE